MKFKKLLANITTIPKIAEKTAAHLGRLKLLRIIDILLFIPHRLNKIKIDPSYNNMIHGEIVSIEVTLDEIGDKPKKNQHRAVFKILCNYQNKPIDLIFFNYYPGYVLEKLAKLLKFRVYGKIERYMGKLCLAHPKFIFSNDIKIANYEPVYHLTYGVVSEQIHNYANYGLSLLSKDDDLLNNEILNDANLPSLYDCFSNIHNPASTTIIEPNSPYIKRLAFDELLAHQLAIQFLRNNNIRANGISFINDGKMVAEVIKALPFTLTLNQQNVIAEIAIDQKSSNQMLRLVQGDVGSGKTAVALIAAIGAIASGAYQVALMAPLDILANQHYNFFNQILEDLGIKVVLLTGKIKNKARAKILKEIEDGTAQIVIGTHALFQEKAVFKSLGLVIIDEQHRFGVNQRLEMLNKGFNSDMLMLTATPIPRTLCQTIYADLDVSIISEKPPGRIPIKTVIMSDKHLPEIISSVERAVKKGEKVYWLCPLIEESDDELKETGKIKATSIEARFSSLKDHFADDVGYIHGKLSAHDKELALNKFYTGETKILVATTVIEVGIDVKDATIIIIENAEQYGLAQLHQLRGRVGRGTKESFCILLYSNIFGNKSIERLKILKNTDDGFKISEEDLRIRGGGDIAGLKQSGLPDFKVCNLYYHADLAAKANILAKEILSASNYEYDRLEDNYKILMEVYNYRNYIVN